MRYRSWLKIAPRERDGSAEPPLRQPAAQAGRAARLNGLERLDLLGLRALGPPAGRVLTRE